MQLTAIRQYNNKKGFTLIELMIALVILFISMTAILDFLVQYHKINLVNVMRNEAINIAESKIADFRNTDFNALVLAGSGAEPAPGIQRTIRNLTVNYQVAWTVSPMSTSSAAIQINVTWLYLGRSHLYNTSTIVSTFA